MTRPQDELGQALRRLSETGEPDASLEPYADTLRGLSSLQATPERDLQAVSTGRQAFLNEAASIPVSRPLLSRHRAGTRDGRKELRPMNALVGLLVAVALLLGGGGVTAFAAQDALPIDVLYPVKLATEDLQLGLTSNPADQVDLLENWIDRRFQEMRELTNVGEVVPLESAHRLERQLGQALQIAAQTGDPEQAQLLQRLQLRLETNMKTMEQLRAADPNGVALQTAQQAMLQTHAEVQGALEDPAAFRTRYGAGRPDDAPVQPEVMPGEPPVSTPGASGQGDGQHDGQGSGEGQNPNAGQGAGSEGGYSAGDGSCTCTPQADGMLICPSTCDPNLYLWSTPGPHGNGQGAGGG